MMLHLVSVKTADLQWIPLPHLHIHHQQDSPCHQPAVDEAWIIISANTDKIIFF